jgi:KaiC/GvpD/RAD55 family RecA-like ATPase
MLFDKLCLINCLPTVLFIIFSLNVGIIISIFLLRWLQKESQDALQKALQKECQGALHQEKEWRKALPGVVIMAPLILLHIFCCSQHCQLVQIKESFTTKFEFSHPSCFLDNTTMIEHMKDNLIEQSATGVYYLLEGPHGSGKTTALKSAVQAVSNNIIYLTVDQSKDFGISLANTLSIDLGCKDIPFFLDPVSEKLSIKRACPETLKQKVRICLNLLEEALQLIQEEGNSPPILIIDHVNLLLDESAPETIVVHTLQAFAKRMADERLITIYFASSEGKVYNLFHQKSASSRLVIFPHRTWDLPRIEAVKYLECLCQFASNDIITEVIDVVGGHFTHMIAASAILKLKWDSGVNLEEVKNELFETVIGDLESLHISKTPPKNKTNHILTDVTWSLVRSIIAATNNQIRLGVENILENLTQEEKDQLTRANIFYFDWIGQYVTFQSTLVHSYFYKCN